MKILVIGASRGIGLEVVTQGLARGREIAALLRDPSKLRLDHPRLTKLRGDARNLAEVRQALAGRDAVCSCVGIGLTTKPVDLFSRGAANILEALKETPHTKFISVTGVGAGDSRGHGGFFYDRIFQPLLLKTIYDDKDREESLIKASDAEWLIVRPGFLTNGPRTGKYRALTEIEGVTAGRISRADVADFILNQLEAPTMFRRTPMLTC